MTYYLIDSENVGGHFGNADFKLFSTVIQFVGHGRGYVYPDVIRKLKESHCTFEYIRVWVGTKNALDYQLVSYLGYLLSKDPNSTYYIVSRDKGYDQVISYLRGSNFNVIHYKSRGKNPKDSVQ